MTWNGGWEEVEEIASSARRLTYAGAKPQTLLMLVGEARRNLDSISVSLIKQVEREERREGGDG